MAKLTTQNKDDLFDPGFENQPGDYTRASQGFRGDGSTGTLLSGLGDLIKDKFTMDDQFLKQRIREEATVEADRVRNIFSGMDQRQGGWTLKAVGVENPDLVVGEITKRGERLKKLDQAYASGKITGTHYWTMLDVAARELRSKYPGYREHIDNVMSDLTGATPANQVVAGIRQDAMRDAGGNDPDKMLAQMMRKASEEGYLKYTGFQANGEGLPVNAKGERVDLGTFMNAVGAAQAQSYKLKNDQQVYETQEKAGKANSSDAMRLTKDRIDAEFTSVFKTAIGAGGGTPEEVTQKLVKTANDVANGKSLPGQDLTQVTAQWASTRSAVKTKLNQVMVESPGYKNLTPDQRRELNADIERQLAEYDDIITNKNFGLAVHNDAKSKNILDSNTAAIIDRSKTMRNVQAMNKIGGQNLVQGYMSANPASFNSLMIELKNDSITEMLANGTPIAAEVTRAAKQAKISNAEYYDVLLNQMTKAVLDPKTPKEALDNAIKALYGPENANLLTTYKDGRYMPEFINPKGLDATGKYYAQMTSPEMTKRIVELSKSTGDSTYWTNYYAWATHAYTNSSEVHKALNDIKRIAVESDQPFGVKYDPATGGLTMVQRSIVNSNRNSGAFAYPAFKAQLSTAIDTFNRVTQPITRIMNETQRDPSDIINRVFSFNGMDPNDLSYRKPK
jgi:hypothetical protein